MAKKYRLPTKRIPLREMSFIGKLSKRRMTRREVKKHKTRISFWAEKCSYKFINKKSEKLYHKLLKIEEKLEKIRDELFDMFTK